MQRKPKAVKAWMPLGQSRLIVSRTKGGFPTANDRMEVFFRRKDGAKYWGNSLVRVTITIAKP